MSSENESLIRSHLARGAGAAFPIAQEALAQTLPRANCRHWWDRTAAGRCPLGRGGCGMRHGQDSDFSRQLVRRFGREAICRARDGPEPSYPQVAERRTDNDPRAESICDRWFEKRQLDELERHSRGELACRPDCSGGIQGHVD